MTLQDFFTLTEMRDGLTAPSRVQELISVIQKEKDSVTKSSGDANRQRAAVASSIAATESRECIDLFLQLDGLSFMNRWLLDADKFDNDTEDGFVEESINALLNAIVKLQLDCENSLSSGICMTIENLLCHHSIKVRDKARALLDSWKPEEIGNSVNDGNTRPCNNRNDGNLADSLYCVNTSVTPTNERDTAGNSAADPTTYETERPTDFAPLQPKKVEDELVPENNEQHPSQEKLNQFDARDASPDPLLSSPHSNSGCEMMQDEDGHPTVHAKVTTGARFPDDLDMLQNGEGQAGVLEARRSDEAEKRANKVENLEMSLRLAESTALKASESEYGKIPEEANFGMSGVSAKINDDASAMTKSESNGEKDERVIVGRSGSTFKRDEDAHGHELNRRKVDESKIFFSKIKYGGAGDEDKDPSCNRNKRTDASISYRLGLGTSSCSVVDSNRSNVEIDYGIVDALQVARQVAQEVAREVVDYKERFCSSPSGRDSSCGLGQTSSLESIQERDSSTDSLSNKLSRQNNSSEASSEDDESDLENQNGELGNSLHDLDYFQPTEATREPKDKAEKGHCAFDLNQEVCSDDVDHPENVISMPISIVSAVAPLEFEEILGWKGSAATSAFRPASPRKKYFGDEIVNAERENGGQKLSSLNIDLNVTESEDDKIADVIPIVPIPASCSQRSGELYVEVSSRRHDILKLDLNQVGDDGESSISDLRPGLPVFFHLNSRHSRSSGSSSSSIQRNVDLNDEMLAHGDFTKQRSDKMLQASSVFGKAKQDPVISILGAKVELSKKDHISQTLALLNGNKSFETSVNAATTAGGFLGMGPRIPFQQHPPPMWAFNGLAPAVYHPGYPIPYMMDHRGAHVLHQTAVGHISTVCSAYPQSASPFMMSMDAGLFPLNGPYPSPLRPALDLNSGFPVSDGVNRDSGIALRQFFVPEHGLPTEEPIMGGLAPSSSGGPGVGTKRKEPDRGREPYPTSLRLQQPTWK